MFKLRLISLFIGLSVCLLAPETTNAAEIRKISIPDQIIIPGRASAQEKNAAVELKSYLDRITDKNLTIVSEGDSKQNTAGIYVGATRTLAKDFPAIKLDKLGPDSIVIKSSGDDIFIAGQGKRGTLYAVYSFLEDFCGVRWWTPTSEKVPHYPQLKVTVPNILYTPQMDYRDSFYYAFNSLEKVYPKEARIKFCVKMKNNGFLNGIPSQWGDNTHCLPGGWPTFSKIMPPDRYFKNHPEWYSEHNGKRDTKQLCLTNMEMRKEMTRNFLNMIRSNPQADQLTITQNDTQGACECAKCLKENAKEGAHSGLLLQCVNSVAEAVEKEYPNAYVNTLAYSYNFKEPKITKPRKNVSIQVCTPLDGSCFIENPNFMKSLKRWKKMAPKLLAWTYQVDFGDMLNPLPNAFNIGPEIKVLADNNVTGVFAQGNSYAPVGDFAELKAWLTAKMLWDPQSDDKALIKEFMQGYYGAAAAPLTKYLKLLKWDFKRNGKKFKRHNAYATPPKLKPWLSLDAMNRATKLFNAAEKSVANDPEKLERVKKARMAIEFQWLIGQPVYYRKARRNRWEYLGPKDQNEAFSQFFAKCQKYKVHRLCEGNGSLNVLHPAIFGKK